jgi:hypothetical protein
MFTMGILFEEIHCVGEELGEKIGVISRAHAPTHEDMSNLKQGWPNV